MPATVVKQLDPHKEAMLSYPDETWIQAVLYNLVLSETIPRVHAASNDDHQKKHIEHAEEDASQGTVHLTIESIELLLLFSCGSEGMKDL